MEERVLTEMLIGAITIKRGECQMHDKVDGFALLDSCLSSDWKIYIDTCSLYRTVEPGMRFWPRFEELLVRHNAKFTVTAAAFNELKKHKHSNDHAMQRHAEDLEKVLVRYNQRNKDLMSVAGSAQDSFHDNVIVSLIKERCLKYSQVYITNDLANAWDVFNVVKNSMSSNRGTKALVILKVSKGGLHSFEQLELLTELSPKEISDYFEIYASKDYERADAYLISKADGKAQKRTNSTAKPRRSQGAHGAEAKKQEKHEAANASSHGGPKSQITFPIHVPTHFKLHKTGDTLTAYDGRTTHSVELGGMIGRGGEGHVYEARVENDGSQSPYLAKLYKKTVMDDSSLARQTLEKVEYIVSEGFFNKSMGSRKKLGRSVKFPLMALSDEEGNFVGYLMKQGHGIKLSELIADGAIQSEFERKYPRLTKIDLITICLNFLEVISALHRRKIIVGDLNANNILVDVDTNYVTLLDADSFQYGDRYPCHVGVREYTSPEFFKDHSTGFRTVQNELFVIARILFETLMLVDNPYNSRCSAGDPVVDMLNGTFRYTLDFLEGSRREGRQSNSEAPSEDLAIRWGHLSRDLKNAFGNTFHCEGAYWNPSQRLNISRWKKMLEDYRGWIEESIAAGDGWESNDVFPMTPRAWVVNYSCSCGSHGKQDANVFKRAMKDCGLRLPDEADDYARRQCFSCFCCDHQIIETTCSECGRPMYALRNSRYTKPLCVSCRRKHFHQRVVSPARASSSGGSPSNEIVAATSSWDSARPSSVARQSAARPLPATKVSAAAQQVNSTRGSAPRASVRQQSGSFRSVTPAIAGAQAGTQGNASNASKRSSGLKGAVPPAAQQVCKKPQTLIERLREQGRKWFSGQS